MVKSNVVKLMLVVSLLAGLAWVAAGGNYPVTQILGRQAGIGKYIVESIQMCEDGQSAIMVGIANSDDAHLYKYDLNQDKVVAACDVGVLYGPRGTSGLAINLTCTKAYVPNYPANTLSVIDLTQLGTDLSNIPDCVTAADEIKVSPKPTEATITYPDDAYVLVTDSFSDTVTVIDTASNTKKCEVEVGFGPNQAAALGREAFYIADRYSDDVAVLNPNTCEVHDTPITGLGRVPQSIAITPDGQWAYAADFVGDEVDVINIPAKAVVAKIAVGDSPRYIISSWDGKFVYVSNTIDKTISVISTATDSVVDTIEFIEPNEPAPIGDIAVSKDNSTLYVFWTGGKSGTPGDFVIFKIDVSSLYG